MPRTTTSLTFTEIKSARPATKEYTLHDGEGLYLLIKPGGAKIWRFRYYSPVSGRRVLLSFGSLEHVSLADARKRRNEYKALIARGIDPQEYRHEQKEAERQQQENTFHKVAADWYAVKTSRHLAANTVKDIWRSLEKYVFPDIGNIPVSKLTAKKFVTLLEPIKARGNLETLKRVLQRINEVMDFAANSGLIEINPAVNVRRAFPKPVKQHMPSIRPEQLPELMQALSVACIEPQTRLLIEWQLLTATRPAEAAQARWSEINQVAATWLIPAGRMKMRREHIIPLSSQALAVLEAMKPISQYREFIFPGLRDFRRPMNSQSANAALKRMGYQGVLVSHGLRSVFSTAANEKGFMPDVVEAALSHVDTNEVRRAYNRSDYLEQRIKLMHWWGEFIEKAATGVTTASGRHGLRVVKN